MKKLNRKGIQRMIDGGGSSGGGGIDMSTLAGYASQAWVNQNYISIEFFRQIFRLYDGTLTDDPDNEEDIEIMPNDELPEDTDDVNIRAMFGFWTKQYVTSLGQGGEGGSGDTGTLAGLLDVQLSSLQPGDTLIYDSTLHKWVNGDGGTNISLTQGTGIRITTSGNNNIIALDTVTGLTAGTYTKVTVDAYGRVTSGANPTTLAGYGITDAIGTGVTWWGRTISNNAVSGDMTGVGTIAASGSNTITSANDGIGFRLHGSTRQFGLWLGTGGVNRGIYDFTSGTDKWLFYCNASDTILNYGNVGIGTVPSASFKLHVDGAVRATRLYLTDSVYLEYDNINQGIHLVGAGFYSDTFVSALGVGSSGGGSTGTLAGLLDVQLSSLHDGDALIYDSTLHKWVNGEGGTNISLTQGTGIRITTSGNNNTIALDTVTGLTAGTYTKVTVDAYGRVTSGANPTTLAGYGITDAISTGVRWWGRTISNNAVSGNMTGVGTIAASGSNTITSANDGIGFILNGSTRQFGLWLGTGGVNRGIYDFTSGTEKWLLYCNASDTILNYGNVGIGTTSPTEKLDVRGNVKSTAQLISTISTGTAPLVVSSTTKVTNLNADMLDGLHAVNIMQDCEHNASGTNGEEGFVKVAVITISKTYANSPIVFRVVQRGRMCGELTLRFSNASSTNVIVEQFSYTGDIAGASVVKNGTVWSLYIQKSEAYDSIGISLKDKSSFIANRYSLEWTDVQETPSGTSGTTLWEATCRYYFSHSTYLEFDSTKNGVHLVGGGLYADAYVSALGAQTSGGGGSTSRLANLFDVHLSNLQNGQALVYNSITSKWENQTIQQGGGSGSVSCVIAGTGLTTDTGGSIISTGTISINSTYLTYISHGQTAYGWGDHSQAGYLTGITGTMVNSALGFTLKGTPGQEYDLDDISTLQGYFDDSGNANSALCLTTQSKSAWGVQYWNAAGKPVSISGSMSGVGNISFDQSGRNIGETIYFNTTKKYLGIGTSASGTYRLTVSGLTYLNGNVTIPSGKTLTIGGATLSWDSTNNCLKVSTGFSSDAFISAFGVNSSGGGGGSVSLNTILSELNNVSAGTGVLVRSGSNSWSWQPYSGGSGSGDVTWSALADTSDTRQIAASHLNVLSDYALADEVLALTGGTVTGDLTVQSLVMQYSNEINGVNNGDLHFNYRGNGNVSICNGGGLLSVGSYYNPGYRLYVNGTTWTNTMVVNGLTTSYDQNNYCYNIDVSDSDDEVSSNTTWWSYGWSTRSDIRMKDVYEYTYMDYREVANAPIINFSWKNRKNKNLHLGSVAQYWQTHTPYGVVADADGMLSMDYGAIALASAVAVARKTVNLEQRIERLEEENAQLRAELSELKAS